TVTTVQLGSSLLRAATPATVQLPPIAAGCVPFPPLETASFVPGPTTRVVSAAVVPATARLLVVTASRHVPGNVVDEIVNCTTPPVALAVVPLRATDGFTPSVTPVTEQNASVPRR